MTDKIESQGKTVEDAVNEALLKMGARKDEVSIEVLEEPKGGLFGILGGKRARVLVTRKPGGGRRSRGSRTGGNEDVGPHQLSDGESGRGRRGGRSRGGRRNQPAARQDDSDGNRQRGNRRERSPEQSARSEDDRKQPARGERSTRSERSPSSEDDRKQAAQDGNERGGRSRRRRGGRSRRSSDESRGRDSDRRQDSAAENAQPAASVESRETASDNRGNERREERREERRDEGGRSGDRRRGGRSRRQRGSDQRASDERGNERPSGDQGGNESRGNERRGDDQPSAQVQEREKQERRGGRSRFRRNRQEQSNEVVAEKKAATTATPETDMAPDETILTGIPATKYAEPLRGVAEEDLDQALVDMTNGMLIRAGFPIRCEVKSGEYRQVRVVTDESSAGMLIGRHGATVDAIEHLVERMAGMAAGDRVRMNLDINNYRRRREESLHDRVNEAAGMVLENGRTYHMEPMCARERRIVHLQVEKVDGLRTFTMGGAGGKHVVIALDNGDRNGDEQEKDGVVDDDFNEDVDVNTAGADTDDSLPDYDEFDDGPQPETNELVVDDDDHRPLI